MSSRRCSSVIADAAYLTCYPPPTAVNPRTAKGSAQAMPLSSERNRLVRERAASGFRFPPRQTWVAPG